MIVLVDTHLCLWAVSEPHKLSEPARTLLETDASELWFSAASIWEITIKSARRRPDFDADPGELRRGLSMNGWRELAITSQHAAATRNLPLFHKDPFDRMLIAQAQCEGFALATSDAVVASYPGNILRF